MLFSVTTVAGPTRWDAAQIVVQSLSNQSRKVIVQGGSDRYLPTGHLVYALGDALLAVAFDVGRLEVTGGPVSVVEEVARPGNPALNTATANYAVSEGGTLVYLSGISFRQGVPVQTRNLVWVDRQGREEPLATPPDGYIYPRLSPDGTRLALDIRRPQGQDIWIWDLRRQTMTPLTFSPAFDGLPVWSADGRRLVWTSNPGTTLNLYWQAADGTGTVERLTESPNAHRASGFTPDGTRLVISEIVGGPLPGAEDVTGRANLAMLSLSGDRTVTPLVQTSFAERNGEVSPDGRWLSYESNESGQFQIYVRPFPAVDQGRWQVSTGGGRQPLWARDGRELIYVTSDGTLMAVPVDLRSTSANFVAGTPAKLVGGDGYYFAWNEINVGRTYDVSPDGKRFLRIKRSASDDTRDSTPQSFVIVENWTEELQRRVPTN